MKSRWPLILVFLVTACGISSDSRLPFEAFFDFEAEIQKLTEENPEVMKTIIKNGIRETITGTVNWHTEFQPFKDANINQPAFRDRYSVEVKQNGTSESVQYLALDSGLAVRSVSMDFEAGEVTELHITRRLTNKVMEAVSSLTYLPGKQYHLKVDQKVEYAFETSFELIGDILPKTPIWRGTLDMEGVELPFNFQLGEMPDGWHLTVHNGEERICVKRVSINGDSIEIDMPIFNSLIKGKFDGKHIEGHWHNLSRGKDYSLAFKAEKGNTKRFERKNSLPPAQVAGHWEVAFSPETEDEYPAVGIFEQEGDRVWGTFLTETGDYRYLEGVLDGEELNLSAFDGSHAFAFKAKVQGNNIVEGTFWSGKHWSEPWKAVRNESFELANPDSLTYLKPGYDKLAFAFPDLEGNTVSLEDPRFRNKVVIVEVMGSWCPNCMDCTRFLNGLHEKYGEQGLEIVALAYEKGSFEEARRQIVKHQQDLDANFTFLIAGDASKKVAEASLPMLNNVLSFPTSIYIDRNGKVRRIHTGFYGPGTGDYYSQFMSRTETLLEQLLRE